MPPEADAGLDIERLLQDAIGNILAHQNPDRFFGWMRQNIRAYADPTHPAADDERFLNAIASMFGRSIWNAIPLPQHRFRPQPIPEPVRNQSCPYGSGRKYKHCCARVPRLPITADEIWPLVFDALSAEQREAALDTTGVPASVFVDAAVHWLDEGKPSKAAGLLEPMFFPRFTCTESRPSMPSTSCAISTIGSPTTARRRN